MDTQEAYDKGRRDAVKEILDYLDLWGGQEVLTLKEAIRYKMASGYPLDYTNDPEAYEVMP
jgi:hypothetical protein